MDIASVGVIVLFALAGALVAYVADNLGRHLGKNRKTLFGLRPRHTGTLLVTLAGLLIPLLTIGVMTALSSDLRTILVEGRRLIQTRDKAQGDLNSTQKLLRESQTTLDGTKKNLAKANQETLAAQTKARTADELRAQTAKQVQSLKVEATKLSTQLAPLKIRIEKAGRELRSSMQKNASLLSVQKDLEGKNAESRRSYDRLRQDLRGYEEQYQKLSGEIDRLTKDIANAQKEREQLLNDLDKQKRNFEDVQKALEQKNEQLLIEIRQKQNELQDLSFAATNLRDTARNARQLKQIFTLNEEVARLTTPIAMSYPEADRLIDRAFGDARKEARNRGAGKIGQFDFAGFQDIREPDTGFLRTAEEQRQQLREDLVNQSEALVLILYSVWNCFQGESVPLRYAIYPNRLIYKPGVIISEVRIDGDRNRADIMNQITLWLTRNVPAKVTSDGVIPALGRSEQFASVSQAQLWNLADIIRQEGRLIRLQLISTAEIRAAGPLKFDFRLR